MSSKLVSFLVVLFVFAVSDKSDAHTYHSGECPTVEPMSGFDMSQVRFSFCFLYPSTQSNWTNWEKKSRGRKHLKWCLAKQTINLFSSNQILRKNDAHTTTDSNATSICCCYIHFVQVNFMLIIIDRNRWPFQRFIGIWDVVWDFTFYEINMMCVNLPSETHAKISQL